MKNELFIGVDVGGTHMRTALIDGRGKILEYRKTLTEISRGAREVGNRLAAECKALMKAAAKYNGHVEAIGLGVAGKINRSRGLVVFSPNLPEMRNYPLAVQLQEQTGVPVVMENDANLFGLGEQWLGAGREISNWVGVTLGTGVGGCLILADRLWNGDDLGFAGEIGHTIVDPHGPQCVCGLKGCLEAHSSGRALVEGVKTSVSGKKLTNGAIYELSTTGRLTPADVYKSALHGDETAIRLFRRMGWALGLAIGNLFTFLGIRHAIIGGGVSASWDLFSLSLRESLAEHACMLDESSMTVMRSRLGDYAALLGAVRLVQIDEP